MKRFPSESTATVRNSLAVSRLGAIALRSSFSVPRDCADGTVSPDLRTRWLFESAMNRFPAQVHSNGLWPSVCQGCGAAVTENRRYRARNRHDDPFRRNFADTIEIRLQIYRDPFVSVAR